MRAARGRRIPWGGLAWVAVLVLWLTWAPFLPREGAVLVRVMPPASVGDAVVNLVLLSPAGLVLGLAASADRIRWELVAAVTVLTWIVLVAEGGQVFVEGRHVSLFDGLLNVAGGLFGFRVALRLRRAGHRPLGLLAVTGSHLFFGIVVYVVAVGTQVGGAHRLDGWDGEYGVRAGGEFGAPRDYVGRVDSARICSRDRGGEEMCASGGAGEARRRALARAATRGQHVELSAVVRSASGRQEGPARIVTFSASETLRNATMGQSGRDLILRLRTPMAGDNGSRIQFRLPGAVPTDQTTRVRAAYDGGRVTLESRSGSGAVRRSFDYRLLTVARLVAWQETGYDPVQVAAAAAVALLALFFPLGYGPAILVGRAGLAAGTALAAAAVGIVVMTNVLAVGWSWTWLGAAAATAAAGLLAGWWDRRGLAAALGGGPGDEPFLFSTGAPGG